MLDGKTLLARLAMIIFCTILFVGHSRKEFQKFLMGLKSTGSTVKFDSDLRYPIIAFCHKTPFKTSGEFTRQVKKIMLLGLLVHLFSLGML